MWWTRKDAYCSRASSWYYYILKTSQNSFQEKTQWCTDIWKRAEEMTSASTPWREELHKWIGSLLKQLPVFLLLKRIRGQYRSQTSNGKVFSEIFKHRVTKENMPGTYSLTSYTPLLSLLLLFEELLTWLELDDSLDVKFQFMLIRDLWAHRFPKCNMNTLCEELT